ncbi:MAG: hypothetical protein HC815_24985 [Richelia sp. RM1_1_1]|nr:hypothetical protein [Richelia sp. RM1_1_1]
MPEDPRIQLLQYQLGQIAEQMTNKKQELKGKEIELFRIQQERENLRTEINYLSYQAELIEKEIQDLSG